MNNPDEYFQAGIIVFNIKQMVEENTFAELMRVLKAKILVPRPDIMNKVFYSSHISAIRVERLSW